MSDPPLEQFLVIFLTFPACTTKTFHFFMTLRFDGAGEDGSEVMFYDVSIDARDELYAAFTVWAVATSMPHASRNAARWYTDHAYNNKSGPATRALNPSIETMNASDW